MRRLKREFLRPSMARGCEREGRSCAVSRGGRWVRGWARRSYENGVDVGLEFVHCIGLENGLDVGLECVRCIGLESGVDVGLECVHCIGLENGVDVGLECVRCVGLESGVVRTNPKTRDARVATRPKTASTSRSA